MEVRVKNNRLWRLVHEQFPTEREAAETIGINLQYLNSAINLRECPYATKYRRELGRRYGELFPWAMKICEYFMRLPEWIFPPELYTNNKRKLAVIEMDRISFVGLPSGQKVLQIANESEPEELCRRELRESAVHNSLELLTMREKKIVKMRFGIGIERPQTLGQVGRKLRITKERVRQIEARAIRKLRHPSRSNPLRGFS